MIFPSQSRGTEFNLAASESSDLSLDARVRDSACVRIRKRTRASLFQPQRLIICMIAPRLRGIGVAFFEGVFV